MIDLEDQLRETFRDFDRTMPDSEPTLTAARYRIRRHRWRIRVTASLAAASMVAAVIITVRVATDTGTGGLGVDDGQAPAARPGPATCVLDRTTVATRPQIATGWLPPTFSWVSGSRMAGCGSAHDVYLDSTRKRSIVVLHTVDLDDSVPRRHISLTGKPALMVPGLPATAYALQFRRRDGMWVSVQVVLERSEDPSAVAEHVARTMPDARDR